MIIIVAVIKMLLDSLLSSNLCWGFISVERFSLAPRLLIRLLVPRAIVFSSHA